MLLSMLRAACAPYLRFIFCIAFTFYRQFLQTLILTIVSSPNFARFRFIQDWVFEGVCKDVYDEFMIQVNDDYLRFRGGYMLHLHFAGSNFGNGNAAECL